MSPPTAPGWRHLLGAQWPAVLHGARSAIAVVVVLMFWILIDLPQVTFNLPPKTGETGRGLVKAFRFGLVMQGGSRIVMDVNKPVRIDKAFVIETGRIVMSGSAAEIANNEDVRKSYLGY